MKPTPSRLDTISRMAQALEGGTMNKPAETRDTRNMPLDWRVKPAAKYDMDKDSPQSIAERVVRTLTREESAAMDIPQDWTFKNASIAKNFDRHVREQLPWYDMATGMVSHFGRHYLPEGGLMYDLGASTGNHTRALATEITLRKVRAVSIDYSPQMAEMWAGQGEFHTADVREWAFEDYDFCVCFLLLMFLPPQDQARTLQKLLSRLKPGGCLILFDKVETANGYLGTVLHRLTMAGKMATGVTADEIVKKELSLAGQQRPIKESIVTFAGVECQSIFRFGEFCGWAFVR